MTMPLAVNVARNVMVFMTDSADHITGKAGLTLAITESKSAGAFAATAPGVVDRGSGWYQVQLSSTNTNSTGDYCLHITAAGADPTDVKFIVVGYNPFDGTRLGLTALPNANATSIGGLPTVRTGSTQQDILLSTGGLVTAAGPVTANVIQWSGSSIAAPLNAGVPLVDLHGMARKAAVASATTTTVTLDAGASAVDSFYNGAQVSIHSGTGARQTRRIIAYVGSTKVATVDRAWATTPIATDGYYITGDVATVDVTQWNGTAVAAPSVAGVPKVDPSHWNGTAVAAPSVAGVPQVNVSHWLGTAAAAPTVAGIPRVEVASFIANAISAAAIATGAITNAKFAAGAIDAAAIASNAITSAKIAASAITSSQIATDAIGAAQLAAAGVTKIADGVMNYVIEAVPANATTFIQRLRVMWSLFAQKASGLTIPANTTENFRDAADTKNRATYTMNTSGTRTPGAFDGT